MALVLVVDDEDNLRRLVVRVLTGAGHETVEAQNGHQAIDSITRRVPDIVLTDLFMPDKEGIETIRAIREDHPKLPIVTMTGGGFHVNLELLKMAEKFGANATLAKPFRARDLLEAIDRALGRD